MVGKQELDRILKESFEKLNLDSDLAFCSLSDRPELADFQCNSAFSLAKMLKQNPLDIAYKVVEECNRLSSEYIFDVAKPGFINIKYADEKLKNLAKGFLNNPETLVETLDNRTIVIDYGGANIAKPLHVGHLRSAIIGESLKRIAKMVGNKVIADAHLGDWGKQMGLTILGIMQKYDTSYYFNGKGKPIELSVDDLNIIYPESSKRAKEDEEYNKKAKEITVKLQHKEKGYFDIWKEIKRISLEDVKRDYEILGLDFDYYYGESDSQDYMDELLNIFATKNLTKKSEGALIVDVKTDNDNEPMPPVILIDPSGAELYHTTDLATILQRQKDFNPNEIWYLVDGRQTLHFKQVFRATRKATLVKDETELVYIPFGTVNGKDGKPFKTRDGGTMLLKDLIKSVSDCAKLKLKENKQIEDETLALKIGLSALKFGDMQNYPSKNYIFDPEKFSSFEGKTGPYILYTIVRIRSILNKTNIKEFLFNDLSNEEKNIIKAVIKFNMDFSLAYYEKAPCHIANSIYNIANSVNTFYNQTHILSEENETKKQSMLSVLKLALITLEKGCYALGIETIDRM